MLSLTQPQWNKQTRGKTTGIVRIVNPCIEQTSTVSISEKTKTPKTCPTQSNRISVPLPNTLVNDIPPLAFRVPPKEHHALPPAREPVMQIEAQITRSLVPRRRGALRCCFAGEDFGADLQRDGRVGVAWVGVGERAAAGAGVEGVVCGVAGLGDGRWDCRAGVRGAGGGGRGC